MTFGTFTVDEIIQPQLLYLHWAWVKEPDRRAEAAWCWEEECPFPCCTRKPSEMLSVSSWWVSLTSSNSKRIFLPASNAKVTNKSGRSVVWKFSCWKEHLFDRVRQMCQPLHTRVNGHRFDITHRRTDVSPTAEHFNSGAHSESNMTVMVTELSTSRDSCLWKVKEGRWD